MPPYFDAWMELPGSVKRTVTAGSAKKAATAAAKQKRAGIDNVLAVIDGPKAISTVRSGSVHISTIKNIWLTYKAQGT